MSVDFHNNKRNVIIKYRNPQNAQFTRTVVGKNRTYTEHITRVNGNYLIRTTSKFTPSLITRLLGGVFAIVLLAFVLRYGVYFEDISNGTRSVGDILPTFEGFLDILTTTPTVKPVFSLIPTNLGDWGAFNFLRDFISLNIIILNFAIWLVTNLVSCLEYIFYFLRWVFIS